MNPASAIGRVLALLVLPLALMAAAPSALAHARLLESLPADGQALASPPTQLRLRFNEALEAAFSRALVEGPDGKAVATGPLQLEPGSDRVVLVPLSALAPGRYAVRWSAMGRDGHRMKGVFHFVVH